jgi:hypothetical protein
MREDTTEGRHILDGCMLTKSVRRLFRPDKMQLASFRMLTSALHHVSWFTAFFSHPDPNAPNDWRRVDISTPSSVSISSSYS